MSHFTLDELTPLLTREISARRVTLLGIFVAVSLVFLVLGFFWSKKFTSYVQLYVDDSQIVAPILDTHVAQSRDKANVAREELFSNDIMDRIIDEVGYVDASTRPIERERVKLDIIDHTRIVNANNQLLEIAYEHTDPRIAFETAALFADLFLAKTMKSSTDETTEAFDFILAQVESYRDKLEDAETRLQSFQGQYPGISNSTEGNVEQQIVELRRDLERTRLEYAQADQRRKSLERELSSESSTIANDYEMTLLSDQVNAMRAEVERLRLNYTDEYPDIVRLNQQIRDTLKLADRPRTVDEGSSFFNLNGSTYRGASNLSPVYQQLRSDLARTTADAESLRARARQIETLLRNEIGRSTQSSKVERELTLLTRDYQINKELFEDLLRRQESARLSMSLGAEKQGVLYRIAQPANYPYLPTGLRFMHIAAGGLVAASLLPFLCLFVFLKIDPRIRTVSAVTDVLELPLLTVIPRMSQPGQRESRWRSPYVIAATVGVTCVLYVVVFIIKYQLDNAGAGNPLP